MRKVVASALLALLFGCSSEAPQVFQTPNWQRDAIIAAPGAKPLEVQEDVDAKGRKEWRYLYRPAGKPGFQIELDGDREVEQVVVGYDRFRDAGFEQDNATAKEMARKALAILTGGDGREIDDLIEVGTGEGNITVKRREINTVEVAPYASDSMVMFTLQRPTNAQ